MNRFDRRSLLKCLGSSALALPILQAFEGNARAATPPKRLFVWFQTCGTIESEYRPKGTETDFQLGRILAPLEAYKKRMLLLGPDTVNPPRGDVKARWGLTMDTAVAHIGGHDGILNVLTGAVSVGDEPNTTAGGISVDQFIAGKIGASTRFKSLELGVQIGLGENNSPGNRMCFAGPGKPLPPEGAPKNAFNRVFGQLAIDPNSTAAQRQLKLRRAVSDAVHRDFASFRNKVGQDDRARVDAHLQSLTELEARLFDTSTPSGCQAPDVSATVATGWSGMPKAAQQQMDIMAMAFACDLTRVGSLEFCGSAANAYYTWLGGWAPETLDKGAAPINGHHGLTHDYRVVGKDGTSTTLPDKTELLIKAGEWYSQQLAYFLAKLESMKEGSGSVLDNTLVLVVNELSDPYWHANNNMPIFLIGDARGYFRTGRYVTMPPTSHNNLLVSVCNAMGADVTTFGDPAYCTGPLANLT